MEVAYCILCKMHKLRIGCAIFPQYFRKLRLSFVNAQYMRKILCTMGNICATFAQDCTSFPNAQYMRKIYARLYFSLMRNICARCTSFPNAQKMRKIVPLSPMCNIYARLYFSPPPQCARPSHHLSTQHHHSAGHKIFYFLIQIDRSDYIQ